MDIAPMPQGLVGNVWLWSTLAHSLTLLIMGSQAKNRLPYSQNFFVMTSTPAFTIAGFALLNNPNSSPASLTFAVLAGTVLIGVGTGEFVICWCDLFTELYNGDDKRSYLFIGVIVSSFLYIPLAFLPAVVFNMLFYLLPVCSTALVYSGLKNSDSEKAKPVEVHDEPLSPRFIIFCLAYTIPLGFFQTHFVSNSTGTLAEWLPIMLPSVALLFVALFMDYIATKRYHSNLIPMLIMPVAIAGLLLLAILDDKNAADAGILIYTGQELVTVVLYSQFAAIACSNKATPSRVFGYGIAATDIGFIIGMLIATLASSAPSIRSLNLILGIVYVLVLVGFLASGSFNSIDKSKQVKFTSTDSNMMSLENRIDFIARKYDLTPRETEILGYLLRGNSVPAISSKIFLSANTVRTHVAHIYQKTGVHGRDELIELIEQMD